MKKEDFSQYISIHIIEVYQISIQMRYGISDDGSVWRLPFYNKRRYPIRKLKETLHNGGFYFRINGQHMKKEKLLELAKSTDKTFYKLK